MSPPPPAKHGFSLLPLPSGEVGGLLGTTGEGITPSHHALTRNPLKRLSTSPEGRGKEKAFSLVELSIVLVILGLLVGGVLSGQSLIRAAELRAVSTEYTRWVTASQTFRDKYFALPGDMANAGQFWGTDSAANCGWSSATGSNGSPTCSGDGDGIILANYTTPSNEPFRAWQHLTKAGLIEGSYTGICSPCYLGSAGGALSGTNVPKSKFPNAGWVLYHVGNQAVSATYYYEASYGNVLFLGGIETIYGLNNAATFKPEEAWNIDTKLDDGKPATGKITSFESQGGAGTTTCSDLAFSAAASLAASVYRLDNSGANCALIFKTGF